MHAKDPYEAKYQLLMDKGQSTGMEHVNDSEALLKYSNDMDDDSNYIQTHNHLVIK